MHFLEKHLMELPINVIVILFVAVVVGSVLIMFTRQNLNDAQENLAERFRNNEEMRDHVVEVEEASATTILSLAQECARSNLASAEEKICFAIFATAWPDFAALDGSVLPGNFTLNSSAVPANPSGVLLSFDPKGTVEVR